MHRTLNIRVFLFVAVLAGALAAPSAHASDIAVQLDPAQTHVSFTLAGNLHTVHGTFQLKHASLHFDPATGKAGGELVVDARSGASGSGGRDGRMHKSVLESERYPDIVFTPDHVEGTVPASGAFQVLLHGTFRIHGADHELVLPISAQVANGQVTADTHFVVPYAKWGMKNPSNFLLKVGSDVSIEIHAIGHVGSDVAVTHR